MLGVKWINKSHCALYIPADKPLWRAGRGQCGSECTYLPNGAIVNGSPIAMKIYTTYPECVSAHRRQAIAYKNQIAPVIGRAFTVDLYKLGVYCDTRYGYFTSRARCPIETKEEYAKMEEVSYKMKYLGIGGRDAWYENYGVWNGRVVCVDFGDNSA